MSYPTIADFAVVKFGDGASPEVFTIFCGMQDATLNEVANTTDRVVFDCAKPGKQGARYVRVQNTQFTITGSGPGDVMQIAKVRALLGRHVNYQVDFIKDDGTDAGDLLGTYAFQGVLTSRNTGLPRGGEASAEITIEGELDLTWTPAA